MALPFHLVFLLCLTSGLLISGTWSANIERRAGGCNPGWTLLGDRCFIAQHVKKDWVDAFAHCVTLAGHLATIHSRSENDLARELLRQLFGRDVEAWIGLFSGYDRVTEDGWGYYDASKVDFTDWRSGEPNNYGGVEQCVSIRHPSGPGWNDDNCHRHLPYVCGRDQWRL